MLRVFFSLGFPKLSFAQYLFGRLEIKELYDKKKKRTWLIHVVESRTALREGQGSSSRSDKHSGSLNN